MSDALIAQAALAAAVAWGAGLRLYAVVLILGLAGQFGAMALPQSLQILAHPLVIGVSGLLTLAEFVGDKIPLLDSFSDSIHTFIRIPAGAALAAAFFGDSGGAVQTAAALLGGSFAAGSHVAKAGSRAFINTSPEPVSNVAASFGEEAMLGGGLWLAVTHPLMFLAALGMFMFATLWLARKLWRSLRQGRPSSAPG
ncbi:MAG: DUF4126 domain-containing protein [Thiobacillaceae bacterium]|jgi:hypothetical protein|nr:DUF4126 domain-containing protein [Thiobacillaceae bacterium]